MPNTDELLNKLKKETELTHLNESFDFSNIVSKIGNMASDFVDSMNLSSFSLSNSENELIYNVRHIYIDPSWRIITYPNIHNDNKYKIETSIVFNYVMNKIKQNAKDEELSFNPTDTIEEGISRCLKLITGITPKSRITIDEFKYYYQMRVFGSYTKSLIQPKMYKLLSLAKRTPLIISHIDNNLINNEIRSMDKYKKEIAKDFKQMIKNNPMIEKRCDTYLSCITRAIRVELNIYKIIRNTMIQLHREYMYIFRELMRLNAINNESISSVPWLNYTLKMYSDICNLNESVEDYGTLYNSFTNRFNEFISDKSKDIQNLKNAIGYAAEQKDGFTKFCLSFPRGLIEFCDVDIDNIKFNEIDPSNANEFISNYNKSILNVSEDRVITYKDLDIITENSLKIINKLNTILSRLSETLPDDKDSTEITKSKLIKFSILTRLFDSYYKLASYFIKDILCYNK